MSMKGARHYLIYQMVKKLKPILLFIVLILSFQLKAQTDTTKTDDVYTLSLEELMDIPVTTASKTAEKLSAAPATIIVLTKLDIQQRGYTELSQIYNDLPGMDIARPYGDTYMRNYMRGFRNTVGSPYQLLIDGVEFSQLYHNDNEIITTVPISSIERVEVVYGPASSVYGQNALMGVINIITEKDKATNGSYVRGKISGNPGASNQSGNKSGDVNGYYVGDFNFFYKKDDFRLSVSGHLENGDLNQMVNGEAYEFTKNKYQADRRLWGGFVDNTNIAGRFSSPIRHKSVDLRLYFGNTEVAIQSHNQNSGYGTNFAFDRAQSASVWNRKHYSVYVRHTANITDKITSTTLARFKMDGPGNSSLFLESENVTNSTGGTVSMNGTDVLSGETIRVAKAAFWQAQDRAYYLFQDFTYKVNNKLSFVAGLKFDIRDLQKAYESPYGTILFADSINLTSKVPGYTGVIPAPPNNVFKINNRILWQDRGVYVQGKYNFLESTSLSLGIRADNNSSYGTFYNIRAGLVHGFGKFTAKLLYGTAVQEPSPRILYGGWAGAGSDPNLKPEKSKTLETSLTYTKNLFSGLISFYVIRNTETLVITPKPANLGNRDVIGMDIHAQRNVNFGSGISAKFWGYISTILKQDEQKFDATGKPITIDTTIITNSSTGRTIKLHNGKGDIGDLADVKVFLGSTFTYKNLSTTLYGRYVGDKTTISTNPIDKVDAYFTLDWNAEYKTNGVGLGFKITNLFDKDYFHTGLRNANAGEIAGVWAGPQGRSYSGSKGSNNSLLPQPKRFFLISVTFDF
jgi:outer membrane receptor for ferrienterochelin and colicins